MRIFNQLQGIKPSVSPTSSMETMSPPLSASSSPSSDNNSDRVFSPDNLPFNLNQMRRTPRDILSSKKKLSSSSMTPSPKNSSSFQKSSDGNSSGSVSSKSAANIDEMIKMRLYYLGIIKSLEDGHKVRDDSLKSFIASKKSSATPLVNYNLKSVQRRKSALMFEVDKIHGMIADVEQRIIFLNNHLERLTANIRESKTLSKLEETSYKSSIKAYQEAMERIQDEVNKIPFVVDDCVASPGSGRYNKFDMSCSSGISSFSPSLSSSLTRSVTPGPPSREVSFSGSLLSLSGQISELCQGEHGSKLVIKRITAGAEEELELVWSELRLPGSLLSLVVSGSTHTLAVIMSLVSSNSDKCLELWEHAQKIQSNMRIIPGGAEFLRKLDLVKCTSKH